MRKLSFLTALIFIIIVNILFNLLDYKVDLTDDKKHSISKQASIILNDLDDYIFIKVYLDGDLKSDFKYLQAELINLLNSFKLINHKYIDFEFIDPVNNYNEKENREVYKRLVKEGILPTDIEIRTSTSISSKIIFPGAMIYYKDRQEAINFLNNSPEKNNKENLASSIQELEFKFISAIYRITKQNKQKIAFLEGNGELSENEVYDLTESVLKNKNSLSYHYNIERFNIKEFKYDSTTNEVDIQKQIENIKKYKAIIIANPTIPFNILDKYIIDQYVMNGGRILWLVDGVKASMDSLKNKKNFIANKHFLNLDDLFYKYGIRINSNLVEDLRSAQIPIVTGYSNNIPQQSLYPWPYFPLVSSAINHPISNKLDAIKFQFTNSIDTLKNSVNKTILLTTSKQSRLTPSPVKVSLNNIKFPPPIDTFNNGELAIAVLLEGKFESLFTNRIIPKNNSINFKNESSTSKIIVVSDGDIAKNNVSSKGNIFPLGYDRFINYTYSGNKKFLINSIHYLCDEIELTKLRTKEIELRLLDKNKVKLYIRHIQFFNILLPIIIILVYTLLFIVNKKRKYA